KAVLLYESANYDESHFTDPQLFDIERSPNDHVAFGFGAHFCLGAALARLEARVVLEELLARAVVLEPAGDLEHSSSTVIAGVKRAPLRLLPA
ncbi:MAG TPA: cytochrome P450, partial [Microthrixaceae bacterium]|nr:cytochrome P450 [Microthrixaceae bacterium]